MQAPQVIGAYREERESLGKEPGEIVLQALFSWAEDDETAFESAKEWKGTIPPEHYTDPIYEPAEIKANGDEVSDKKFKAGSIIGSTRRATCARSRRSASSARRRSCS